MTIDDHNELSARLLDLIPASPDEEEVVAKYWPPLEAKILSQLRSLVPHTAAFRDQDVLERVLGDADDDSPLPDFVARRLPPTAEAVGALLIEVWLLDSRFACVERLAGYCCERGAMPRWEVALAMSGLVEEHKADWRQSPKIDTREYEPVRDEQTVWAAPNSRQEVVALFEGRRLLGYVRAVFAQSDRISVERTTRLSNLAHALKHAIIAADWRRIERARDALAQIGNRVADPQTFLDEIVTQFLPRTLAVHAASIFFVNQAGDGLVLAHTTGLEEIPAAACAPIYERGVGLTGYVWEQNRSLRFPDDLSLQPRVLDAYTPAPRVVALSREQLPANTRRQFLAVPLVKDREVIGVLRLGGRTGEWRFSESDEALANAVASQIVQIYSHLRAIEEGIEAKAILIKTMELLQVAQTEPEMVRTTLIAITRRGGLSFNRAAYWAFDEDCRSLTPVLLIGEVNAEKNQQLQMRISGPLEQVVKKANTSTSVLDSSLIPKFQALCVRSIDSSEDYLAQVCRERSRNRAAVIDLDEHRGDTRELHGLFGSVEARVIPLWASGSCLGCIYVDNAFDRAPIRKELEEVVLTHARHLAGALKAAREGQQRRMAHEFHRKLSAALVAPWDAYSVARGVVLAIHDVLGFEKILVYYHDAGDGVVRLAGSHGFGQLPAIAFQMGKLINAMVPRVVETRRPYFTQRSEADENIDPTWRELLKLKGPLLEFPLQVGGMMTGVLVINDARVNPGTEFLLRPLADMLGVAVRTIAQEERLEAGHKTVNLLHRIQRDLRLAHNEEAFANELADSLVAIIPAQLCAIYRPRSSTPPQDRGNIRGAPFERRGSAGYPDSLKSAVRYARNGPGEGLTSHVLCSKTLNVPQVNEDERWKGSEFEALTDVFDGKETRAFLGVPLVASDGRVLGAITLTRGRISADDGLTFQRHEQELLSGIAEAVSTVFELKDAQGALQQHIARMDTLSQTNDRLMATAVAVRSHSDVQALSQEVADEVRRACGADLVVVYRLGEFAPELLPSLSGDFWRRDALEAPKMEALRTGQRTVGEYFEDAAAPYGGQLPEGSFAEREGVVSFAHIRVFAPNGDPLICVFINYRTAHRFPAEEQKLLERFARTSGLAIEVALRSLAAPSRGLRVVGA